LVEGLAVSNPGRTVSHSEIKVCEGVWRIKQLNKAFDREKLSLLQRYRGKMRRRDLSSEASNLLGPNGSLGTAISPLASKPTKPIAPPVKEKENHRISFRYRDIPISEFIYEHSLTRSDHAINRGIEKRLEDLCRKRNTKPIDRSL
jgi:hypothetical protein